MEIRRGLRVNFKLIAIISIVFLAGTVTGSIPYTMALDCDNIPAFHIIHLSKIVDCFTQTDIQQSKRLDATNDVFFAELERLDRKIDDATRR